MLPLSLHDSCKTRNLLYTGAMEQAACPQSAAADRSVGENTLGTGTPRSPRAATALVFTIPYLRRGLDANSQWPVLRCPHTCRLMLAAISSGLLGHARPRVVSCRHLLRYLHTNHCDGDEDRKGEKPLFHTCDAIRPNCRGYPVANHARLPDGSVHRSGGRRHPTDDARAWLTHTLSCRL